MRKLDKSLLSMQIDVFLESARRDNLMGSGYREALYEFATFTSKEDIADIDEMDREIWLSYLRETRTPFGVEGGRKAFDALKRYYRARGVNLHKRETAGRPRDISGRELVLTYHKKQLKLREIAKLTDKKVSWIHRVIKEFRNTPNVLK